jgi:hypothetical protein
MSLCSMHTRADSLVADGAMQKQGVLAELMNGPAPCKAPNFVGAILDDGANRELPKGVNRSRWP